MSTRLLLALNLVTGATASTRGHWLLFHPYAPVAVVMAWFEIALSYLCIAVSAGLLLIYWRER